MFSIVIPTLWKSPRIHNLLSNLIECNNVGEIILVDNSSEFFNYYKTLDKVKLIQPKENLYVNPSWNLGVELSIHDNICLCNDDLEFDPILFELMVSNQDVMSDKIVGMHSENYHINSFNNTKLVPTNNRNWGWGCLILFEKKNWIPIPENIKIWYGDDFIFNDNPTQCYNLEGFPIYTEMSTTSDQKIFNEIKKQDQINYNQWKNSH
jgi:hypothetical protein